MESCFAPEDTQTEAVRREVEAHKLLLMTGKREEDREEEQNFDEIIR